jgi:hypothetical protein
MDNFKKKYPTKWRQNNMNTQIIEAKGNTLEEARAWGLSRIPDGLEWLSEKILSDGKPQTQQYSAETIEAAFSKAESHLPNIAKITQKQVVKEPSNRKINVLAEDEAKARQQAQNNNILQVRLINSGKKGFLGIGAKPNEYEIEVKDLAVVSITYTAPVRIEITIGRIRDEILNLTEGMAGGWPAELSREMFEKIDLDALVQELKRYQEMPHPQDPMFGMISSLLNNSEPSRPDYQIVGKQIGRRSNPTEDTMLLTTAEYLRGQGNISPFTQSDQYKVAKMAMELIQHYGDQNLTKFLFHMPRIAELVKSGANTKIIIVEYFSIDRYKGIENILFEIYTELGEGQTFSDHTVTRKLVSIVEQIANV